MKEEVTDNDLMRQFSNCSTDAYNQIYYKYRKRLLNHIMFTFMWSQSDAEEIVQNSLIKVYEHKYLYKATYQFSTWIYTITKNLCLNEIKRNKHRVSLDDNNSIEHNKIQFHYDYIDDNSEIKFIEMLRLINNELTKMDEKYRQILILRYMDKMSLEEISKITDKNINTVKSLLKRGLETIKNNIETYTLD
jgi:RNA polymerase sigma-70 factor, ECF subfamily